MSYQRTEYHRESDRHDDDNKGGWRSWFGLGGNKDDDRDNRGYSYTNTTTYRNDDMNRNYGFSGDRNTSSGYSGAISGGYSGSRGGYGYTTSDDYNRGTTGYTTSYNRDNFNRNSNNNNDRDVYYRQETRTYPTSGSYSTGYNSNNYGSSNYGRDNNDRDYSYSRTTTTYNNDRDQYRPSNTTTSYNTGNSGYGFSGDRDTTYRTTSYNTGSNWDRDNNNRSYSTSYNTPSGGYGQSSGSYSYNRNY